MAAAFNAPVNCSPVAELKGMVATIHKPQQLKVKEPRIENAKTLNRGEREREREKGSGEGRGCDTTSPHGCHRPNSVLGNPSGHCIPKYREAKHPHGTAVMSTEN